MNSARRFDPQAPREEQYTTWFNPTDHPMHVDVWNGNNGPYNERQPTRYIFNPREETKVPSRFDDAIQKVQCTDDECRRAHIFCRKGHRGMVAGGGAPLLVNKGRAEEAIVPDAMDPAKAAKLQASAELAAQAIARKAAEDAMLLAKKKQMDADAELDAREDEALEKATRPETSKARK